MPTRARLSGAAWRACKLRQPQARLERSALSLAHRRGTPPASPLCPPPSTRTASSRSPCTRCCSCHLPRRWRSAQRRAAQGASALGASSSPRTAKSPHETPPRRRRLGISFHKAPCSHCALRPAPQAEAQGWEPSRAAPRRGLSLRAPARRRQTPSCVESPSWRALGRRPGDSCGSDGDAVWSRRVAKRRVGGDGEHALPIDCSSGR